MAIQSSLEIHCYSIPIPSVSDEPRMALFFHRFPEQVTDDSVDDHANQPSCAIHNNVVATVQCRECVKKGLPVEHSYYCSNNCFQDAWMNHKLHHCNANVSNSCNKKTKAQGTLNRCNSWPPFEMVSWFDERIEVVIPRRRLWSNNNAGPANALVPLADGVGFSFKLRSVTPHQLQMCAEEIFVTDPSIQRLKFPSRSLIWLPDSLNTEKHDLTEKVSEVGNIKVLTYNILSDIYVSTCTYDYCPEWALKWEYRRENLLHELIQYKADILCLQEVHNNHFEIFLKPELQKFGYSVAVAFKERISPLYTGTGPTGYTTDGCATFYRKDKFKEVLSYEHEYFKFASSLVEKMDPNLKIKAGQRLLKDNVALVVILEVVGKSAETPASRLCVVNTHIFAKTDFADVKLLQVSDLVDKIEKTIDPKMPLFICGDMNSLPGSDPYVLLTKQEVNIACTQAPDPLCIFQHLNLQHSMKLASAYVSAFFKHGDDIKGLRMKMKHSTTGEPFFTCLPPPSVTFSPSLTNSSPCGCTLDYIFYKEDRLEIEGILDPPDFQNVDTSLPSPLLSSDHVALMGSFRITRQFLG